MRTILVVVTALLIGCGDRIETPAPPKTLKVTESENVPGLCGRATTMLRATVETEQLFAPKATVHDRRACVLQFSGRAVTITSIHYGALVECTNGVDCKSSYVCAVYDSSPLLLSALWYSSEDTPSTLAADCPGFPSDATWTTPSCNPPGMAHPVTEASSFTALVTGEVGGGLFDHCFQGLEGKF